MMINNTKKLSLPIGYDNFGAVYILTVPNQEILLLYREIVKSLFKN